MIRHSRNRWRFDGDATSASSGKKLTMGMRTLTIWRYKFVLGLRADREMPRKFRFIGWFFYEPHMRLWQ